MSSTDCDRVRPAFFRQFRETPGFSSVALRNEPASGDVYIDVMLTVGGSSLPEAFQDLPVRVRKGAPNINALTDRSDIL